MITFAGFAALLLIVRQSAGKGLSALDRFLARTVVGHFFWMAAGSLFPSVLNLYDIPEPWVWKASALMFGIPMLALLLTYQSRRIAATGESAPPLIQAVFVGLGSLSLAAMIGYVFGDFAHPVAAYVSALTVNFLTHGFAFVVALEVILRQEKKA
ncbi:MAG TPA: hypothetical protein VHV58_02140 [Pseudolabrys sp.]|nr:hypothetical protein [Pseudolabrys sp.]